MGVDFQFPRQPDWSWLKTTFAGDVLLHVDADLHDVAKRVSGQQSYLASPYSKLVRHGDDGSWCFTKSCAIEVVTAFWARDLSLAGVTVASPILIACTMCHADHMQGHMDPLDDLFWSRWCQPMLAASGAVIIPPIAGWDESCGVWREACWALRHNVPVYLISDKWGQV